MFAKIYSFFVLIDSLRLTVGVLVAWLGALRTIVHFISIEDELSHNNPMMKVKVRQLSSRRPQAEISV